MAYNTNDVQFVEFEEAQELWRAEMRSRRLRVRLASAIKENIRELAMGPRRSGKDTGRLESLEQSQTEPPKFAGLDMMFAPAGSMAVPLNIAKRDPRPIEWMFVKTPQSTVGDDLEYDDSFPENIADYYMTDDSDDEDKCE